MNHTQKKILKIFLENIHDIHEERKNDEKYINQANDIYEESLKAITQLHPDDENIFHTSTIGLPFDIVFIYDPVSIFNALYRKKSKESISVIIINCKAYKREYESNDFVSIFSRMKSNVIHEIIHYLDLEVREVPVDPEEVRKDPVNHPVEFNAYFQQIASQYHNMIHGISLSKDPLSDFDNRIGSNAREFFNRFWSALKRSTLYDLIKKEEIFRWNKRIYDLYFILRNKLLDKINK
jgi:hypothetical protein